jgi:hypothetical protein
MGAIDRVRAMHIRRGEAHGCRESLTVVVQVNHIETSNPTTPAGDSNFGKVYLDAVYEIKVSKSLGRGWMESLGHVGLQSLSTSGAISGKEG